MKPTRALNRIMIFEDQKTSICQVWVKKESEFGSKGIPDQEKHVYEIASIGQQSPHNLPIISCPGHDVSVIANIIEASFYARGGALLSPFFRTLPIP